MFLLLLLLIFIISIIGCSNNTNESPANTVDSLQSNPLNNYNPGGIAKAPIGGLDPNLGEKTDFEVVLGVIDYGTTFEFEEISIEKTSSGYNLLKFKFIVLPEFIMFNNQIEYTITTEEIYEVMDEYVAGCDINFLDEDTYGIEILPNDSSESNVLKQGDEVQICIKLKKVSKVRKILVCCMVVQIQEKES